MFITGGVAGGFLFLFGLVILFATVSLCWFSLSLTGSSSFITHLLLFINASCIDKLEGTKEGFIPLPLWGTPSSLKTDYLVVVLIIVPTIVILNYLDY